jgi:GH25 family lysozyme M1 (1,4-beta-N-acetylmuramidase)
MQQYTSTGRINGINGYVDMNYLFDETMLNNIIAQP